MLKLHLVTGTVLFALLAIATPITLPQGDWQSQNSTALSISENQGVLTLKAEAPVKFDYGATKVLNELPREPLVFCGTVDSDRPRFAYLQVRLLQGRKELSRLVSSRCMVESEDLFVEFDPTDADRIEFQCRLVGGTKNVGSSAKFRNLQILPRAEYAQKTKLIKVIPGYEACSIELPLQNATEYEGFHSELAFSKEGSSEWIPALPLAYDLQEKCARGSIMNLTENTSYKLRLMVEDNGTKKEFEQSFRTLSSQVPIAKTIELNSESKLPLVIKESGSPSGYVRYTTKPGLVLDGGNNMDDVILIDNAQYIILDSLTLRGGRINGIRVEDADHIQILNCDISGFGRIGVRRTDLTGTFYENDHSLNNDAGIRIMRTGDILVERNYIHDPRGTSSSWFYSHPAGPNAIFVGSTDQAIFRYNDFIGSDLHRWNDAVEGWNNGSEEGSVCRNAEIIGNYFAFGNDDGMELDGGQRNCRFMYNKTEGGLCGISTAPCLVGPTYLVSNLFCQPGDELGSTNTAIKNNYPRTGGRGKIYFLHNTMVGKWSTLSGYCNSSSEDEVLKKTFKGYSRNNLASVSGKMSTGKIFVAQNDFDYDLWHTGQKDLLDILQNQYKQEAHAVIGKPRFVNATRGIYSLATKSPGIGAGEPIPNISADRCNNPDVGILHADMPFRPIPFHADVAMLDFASASAQPIKVNLTVDDPAFKSTFRIARNEASSFIRVEPESGTLAQGKPVTLTVSIDPNGIQSARHNSGAFLIRLPNGMSRPVSVYVNTADDTSLVAKDRADVVRGSVESTEGKEVKLAVDVPKAGNYYLFLRSTGSGKTTVSIDGAGKLEGMLRGGYASQEKWRQVSTSGSSGPNKSCEFSAGHHTITVNGISGKISDFVLTEKPEVMLWAPQQP